MVLSVHKSVMHWIERQVTRRGLERADTVEIGSYDVNGSVRPLFSGVFVGTDMRPGPGVDLMHNIEDSSLAPDYDVVVCTEVLEHTPRPWRAVQNMADSLRKGGVLLVTCRGYDERGCWPVHYEPDDFWRISVEALVIMCEDAGLAVEEAQKDPQGPGAFVAAVWRGA